MMIISFNLTEKEFLDGIKTESRRDWKDRTLKSAQNAWDQGRHVHLAVSKGLHRGGKAIGYLKFTARPVRERLSSMTKENLKAEGGMCKSVSEFCRLVKQPRNKIMTVIRFVKVEK